MYSCHLLSLFYSWKSFCGRRIFWVPVSPGPPLIRKLAGASSLTLITGMTARKMTTPSSEEPTTFPGMTRTWSVEKDPGVYRIAILGDSYVEGLQVEQDKHFVALAQADLNHSKAQPGRRFELMNFGRSGFTQTEELLVLKNEALEFSPDLVILFFFAPNDIMEVQPDTTYDPMRPFPVFGKNDELVLDTSFNQSRTYRIKSLLAPIKNNSALASFVAERIQLYLAAGAFTETEQKGG